MNENKNPKKILTFFFVLGLESKCFFKKKKKTKQNKKKTAISVSSLTL